MRDLTLAERHFVSGGGGTQATILGGLFAFIGAELGAEGTGILVGDLIAGPPGGVLGGLIGEALTDGGAAALAGTAGGLLGEAGIPDFSGITLPGL